MMKHTTLILLLCVFALTASAKKEEKKADAPPMSKNDSLAKTMGLKSYRSVITGKSKPKKGLFTVHQVDDKWYFEIPDSLFDREMIVTTRFSKIAGGGGVYAGELANQQTVLWEKGPNKLVFLRVVTTISVADSSNEIYRAVTNSNLNPIAASFP